MHKIMYPSSCHKPKRANRESIGTEVRSKKECAAAGKPSIYSGKWWQRPISRQKSDFSIRNGFADKGPIANCYRRCARLCRNRTAALCADRLMTQLPVSMKGGDNRFGWLVGCSYLTKGTTSLNRAVAAVKKKCTSAL